MEWLNLMYIHIQLTKVIDILLLCVCLTKTGVRNTIFGLQVTTVEMSDLILLSRNNETVHYNKFDNIFYHYW